MMATFRLLTSLLQAVLAAPAATMDHTIWPEDNEQTGSFHALRLATQEIPTAAPQPIVELPPLRHHSESLAGLAHSPVAQATSPVRLGLSDAFDVVNLREAYRIQIHSFQKIHGRLQIGRRSIPVVLRNISLGGFGIELHSDVLPRQAPGRQVRLLLPIGLGGSWQSYPVTLRHHELASDSQPPRLGLELRTHGWNDHTAHHALQRFVMDRQRSVCRRRTDRTLQLVA